MAKLEEVAVRAGVSKGTASGVLNGAKNFAEKTRHRVLAAAVELGYTPNLAAKRIRRCPDFHDRPRTNIIAHVTRMDDSALCGTFIGSRSLLLAKLAAAKGYYVIPLFYGEKTAFVCPPVQNGHVDGMLAGLPDLEIAKAIQHLVPLVLMDVPFPAELLADVPRVNFDINYGMRVLARELAKLGHRKIATLSINQDDPFSYHGVRCPPLRKACADAGLALHESLSRDHQLSETNNEQVLDKFIAEAIPLIRRGEVTALMLADDLYAWETITRLNAAGIRVPEDVSVTGFAGTPLEPRQSPIPLTTVSYPWPVLLDTALQLLIAEIGGRDHRQGEVLILPELTLKDSTAAPPLIPGKKQNSDKKHKDKTRGRN